MEAIKNNSNNNLENIKSIFILKEIFHNLQKHKWLNIIKYNKKIQRRINITLNDYVELRKIELLIIPFKNKSGRFIKILKKEDEKYYHIFFDDEEKEIKKYFLNKNIMFQK